MQLGFVTAILPELSLIEVAQFAAQTGYDCLEVMCWPPSQAERRYAGVTHLNVSELSDTEAADLKGKLGELNVQISGLGYYPNALSPNGDESQIAIDHIRKVISASARLGIGRMNTFIGRDWTKSVEDNWSRFLTVWKPLIEHAEDEGVNIGIENCPMLFTADEWPGGKNLATSPAIWRRMYEEIPSPRFGLNYDPSHLVWQQMDYLKPIQEFASRLHHVHAKDVRLDTQRLDDYGILAHPLKYHVPKLPGLGEVNWGKFCAVLGEVGYQGPVCVEVEDRAFEHSLAARKAALIQSYTYLRQFITATD